jgi:hypothetical protein
MNASELEIRMANVEPTGRVPWAVRALLERRSVDEMLPALKSNGREVAGRRPGGGGRTQADRPAADGVLDSGPFRGEAGGGPCWTQ